MKSDTHYQIISPPFSLEFREMSKKELTAYYDWFLSTIPERIQVLTAAVTAITDFQNWNPDYLPASLDQLEKWLSEIAETRFRTDDEKEKIYSQGPQWFRQVEICEAELTDQTFSVSIDVGMYLSQVFLKNHPSLRWFHCLKGKKDIDYGQPILAGFGPLNFNPVRMVVTLAYGLTDGTRTRGGLRDLYDIWAKLIA